MSFYSHPLRNNQLTQGGSQLGACDNYWKVLRLPMPFLLADASKHVRVVLTFAPIKICNLKICIFFSENNYSIVAV